nr:hypothetical protein Q903MT_gene2388 [Picea sitchensis]
MQTTRKIDVFPRAIHTIQFCLNSVLPLSKIRPGEPSPIIQPFFPIRVKELQICLASLPSLLFQTANQRTNTTSRITNPFYHIKVSTNNSI